MESKTKLTISLCFGTKLDMEGTILAMGSTMFHPFKDFLMLT